MDPGTQLSELILRWQELRRQGQAVAPEELCSDCPDLVDDFKRQLEALDSLESFLGMSGGEFQTETALSGSSGFAGAATVAGPDGLSTTPPAKTTAAPPPRAMIAGYEILEELGRGGVGVVYKARQPKLDRLVALKMLLSGALAGRQELARFRDEAQVLARLHHPNIVQIHEVGEHDGCPFFALEFVEGSSLAGKLADASLPPREAAALVESLARAVHSAHANGIVHRDLKPSNILLTKDGTPKITDFGLAKRLDVDTGHTHTGAVLGTPSYMPPEQALGLVHEIGPATDTYALGAVLYELLTGRPPFKGATVLDTLDQVLERDVVPPSQLQPKLPRDLETICLKCLQKEIGKRYASSLDLADDLRRFLDGSPIRARRVPWWESAWKWSRRRPAVVALLAVCALAACGLAGLLAWHYLDLSVQVAQARADERLAREEEQQAREQARRLTLRADVRDLLAQAREAGRREDWPATERPLALALDRTRGVAELADLESQARDLQAAAERYQAAHRRRLEFFRHRDQALFHLTPFTGQGLPADLRATREAVQAALALFDVSAAGGPKFDPAFKEPDKAAITAACYELLLVLAAATARPLPGQADADRRRQADEALAVLDRAARVSPPTRAYHLSRARYLAQRGDPQEAARERDRAARAKTASVIDDFLQGEDAYHRRAVAEAAGAFERVLRREPGHFWAQFMLAVTQLEETPAEARLLLNACAGQQPGFLWTYLARGVAHGELGKRAVQEGDEHTARADLPAARAAYARAEASFATAAEDFEKVLDLGPTNTFGRYSVHVNRGVMRIWRRDYDGAVADFQQAIVLMPNEFPAYLNLAQAYERLRDLDRARQQLDKAIALRPEREELYRTRALLHLAARDAAAARQDAEQAARCDANALQDLDKLIQLSPPGRPRDQLTRGRILQRAGRHAEAVQAFDAALAGQPDYADALLGRAQSLYELKQWREAVRAFDRYLAAKGAEPTAAVYRARGQAKARLGDPAGVLEDFTLSLELEPHDPAARTSRGFALLLQGQELARRDFEEAIAEGAEQGDAYAGRGYLRALAGDHRGAVADAEEARRRGPVTARLLYAIGRVYAQAGARVEADQALTSRQIGDLRTRHHELAVEFLGKALAAVPAAEQAAFWQQNVARDAAWNPLRSRPDFRQLEDRHGRAAP